MSVSTELPPVSREISKSSVERAVLISEEGQSGVKSPERTNRLLRKVREHLPNDTFSHTGRQ
jgi:hypothetical protein